MASIQYQTLLGDASGDFDGLTVQDLTAENAIIKNLILPDGAEKGLVLTSDDQGLGKWEMIPEIVLAGDAVGKPEENVVNTLAGGTIPVNNIVLLDAPQTMTYKTLSEPVLTGVTDADELQVNNVYAENMTAFGLSQLTTASVVSLNTANLRMNQNGNVGDVLMVTDELNNMSLQPLPAVILSGDASGSASATQVNSLANGTIPVNTLVTLNGAQTLTNKTIDAVALKLPNGNESKYLKSDSAGNASWELLPSLTGDASGTVFATQVNSLANGTIPVNSLVTLNGVQTLTNKSITATSLTIPSNAGASKVLTSDASGNATWQVAASGSGGSQYKGIFSRSTQYATGDEVGYSSDSLFANTVIPATNANRSSYTLGTHMAFSRTGIIQALRMYVVEGSPNGGYSMTLRSKSGSTNYLNALINGIVAGVGWVTVPLSTPLRVLAGYTYIVGFNTAGKYYPAITPGATGTSQNSSRYINHYAARYQSGFGVNLFTSYYENPNDNFYCDVVFQPDDEIRTIYRADSNTIDQLPPTGWTAVAAVDSIPTTQVLRDENGKCGALSATSVAVSGALSATSVAVSGNATFAGSINFVDALKAMLMYTNDVILAARVGGTNYHFSGAAVGDSAYRNKNGKILIGNGDGAVPALRIQNNSLYLPSSGGLSSPLNHYEEWAGDISWNGAFSVTTPIRIVRIGKMVTMSTFCVPNSPMGAVVEWVNTQSKLLSISSIPPQFRFTASYGMRSFPIRCITVLYHETYVGGFLELKSDGFMIMYSDVGSFHTGEHGGFWNWTVSWVME